MEVWRRSIDPLFLIAGVLTTFLLLLMLFYPVGSVFFEAIVVDGQPSISPILEIVTDPFYHGLFAFTTYQAILSTILSLAIGLPGAYIFARYEFPGRKLLRSLTLVPFVLPSMMVAVGFAAMFGINGPLNRGLRGIGFPTIELMFTLEIIILAHAFYNAPLVVRIVAAAWDGIDARAIETARSLGATKRAAFRHVVVPQLLPALLTSALLTFIFTFMTFPIVLALGGLQLATVEVWLYDRITSLRLQEAAALAVLEAVITLFLIYLYLRYESRQAATRNMVPRPREQLLGTIDIKRVAIGFYGILIAIVFLGPILSMLVASVTGIDGSFTTRYYEFLLARRDVPVGTQPDVAIRNSILFAVGALIIAVPMGLVISIATTRDSISARLIGTLAMLPFAVSGIVIGLGLLQTVVFGIEIAGHRIQVTGATAVVAAHAVGAYPFVIRTVSPALRAMDTNLVAAARALGASRTRALWDIELPLIAPAVAAGAAFTFAISIGEFNSTVVLVEGSTAYTMPIAVERYLADRTLGPATAMGSVLLVVTALSFVALERLGGYGGFE